MPLNKKATIGTWIKDFKKSDAPQFKGKTEKERRDMAIAAYLNKEEFVYEDLQRDAEVRQKKQDRKEQDIERIKGMISRHQSAHDHHKQQSKEADNAAQAKKHSDSQAAHARSLAIAKEKLANRMNENVNVDDAHYDAQQHSNGSMSVKKVMGKASLIMKSYHKEKDGHSFAKKHGYKASNYVKTPGGSKMHLHKESTLHEDMNFRVEVEGLPAMFMYGSGPAQIKTQLRKIIKQPSMITSVKRVTDAEVKRSFRLKAQGRDDDSDGEIDSRQEDVNRRKK